MLCNLVLKRQTLCTQTNAIKSKFLKISKIDFLFFYLLLVYLCLHLENWLKNSQKQNCTGGGGMHWTLNTELTTSGSMHSTKESTMSSSISLLLTGRGRHRHLQIGRMLDIDLILEPPHAPSPRWIYPKCGNLCGQRGRKRFLASWGLRMSHICPCTPCPSPQGYRSKVESHHFAHHCWPAALASPTVVHGNLQ